MDITRLMDISPTRHRTHATSQSVYISLMRGGQSGLDNTCGI